MSPLLMLWTGAPGDRQKVDGGSPSRWQVANADVDTKLLAIILELNTGLFKRRENRGAPSPSLIAD